MFFLAKYTGVIRYRLRSMINTVIRAFSLSFWLTDARSRRKVCRKCNVDGSLICLTFHHSSLLASYYSLWNFKFRVFPLPFFMLFPNASRSQLPLLPQGGRQRFRSIFSLLLRDRERFSFCFSFCLFFSFTFAFLSLRLD